MPWDKKCAICGVGIPHRPVDELNENGFNLVKIGNFEEYWYCPKHSTQDMLDNLKEMGHMPDKPFVKGNELRKKGWG